MLIECDTGIHMFYDLKHHDHVPDGRNIKPPDAIEEYFIQITTEELNSHLKLEAGSLILVYKVLSIIVMSTAIATYMHDIIPICFLYHL